MRRLLIRPGAIGDVIVSLPALEHLRADYTEVWTNGPTVPLIRFADRVRSIACTQLDLFELGLALPSFREELAGFDEIVSWYGTSRPEFRGAVEGLPFRFLDTLPRDSEVHASDFYSQQVGGPAGLAPQLPVERADRGFIAIHAWSGSPSKNWPYFDDLARQMEVKWCECPEGKHRFDNLWFLAQWLAGARLYIGNDSGITHLAAACGVPTIAIFGPTEPAVWAPRGARVIRREPLEALTVEEVRQVMVECLGCEP